jgi:ABC-type branched-subunit amino acid transport system substrate-binding protein
VGRGADAYFKYVNSKGGVFGRKIDYKYLDDEFDVAKTITLTRQLVEQDQVFAIFNSVGTEHALAIRSYLNDRKVPQLFIGSGVSKLATEHAKYPWSMGYLPSFAGEGAVYGRYIATHRPKARIAVLYENSDFGKDMLNGLRHGLGGKGKIVGTQAYEVADADVASQLAKLKSSGADTLMLFATPKFAIFGYVGAFRLGWHPQVYVTSVSISPDIMKIARVATSRKQVEGSVSIAFVKDPTAKQWAKDRAVRLYKSIMQRFLPSAKSDDVFNYYGMAVAYTMVDTLRKAGRNLTRAGVLKAATHLNEVNPFLLPGVRIQTSPSDYYPMDKVKLARYKSEHWQFFGNLVRARD